MDGRNGVFLVELVLHETEVSKREHFRLDGDWDAKEGVVSVRL